MFIFTWVLLICIWHNVYEMRILFSVLDLFLFGISGQVHGCHLGV